MSLAAIQDNLVKTSLVQQTQSRGDDVSRGQQIAQAAAQREHNRQEDQVVISTHEAEQAGIRTDEERKKEEQRKKRKREEEEAAESPEENASAPSDSYAPDGRPKADTRAMMRRINIVI